MRLLAQSSINTSVLMHNNVGHENTRLVKNGSFEGHKEEEDAIFNSEGLLLIDYPLEEMTTEIGDHQTKEAQQAQWMEREGSGGGDGAATIAVATAVPVIKKLRRYRCRGSGASGDGHHATASSNWPTTNIDVAMAAPALAFFGLNYDTTSIALPPNPSLQSLAKVWSPVMYRQPAASQAAVPLAAAVSSSMAAPFQELGASLSHPWTMNRMH
ncbi:hypothetical protein GUJ93_ZPchr0012g19873 [Zizania palustris]|uniref:Uncharacterized protein n=1 Tax=Zizania palustris TaxID=103762 RepID=A0A8J5WMW9_ZIZPA|nr:hypothetical protein GUJ93_ZPchr0012g19873 [Zizania palustris]